MTAYSDGVTRTVTPVTPHHTVHKLLTAVWNTAEQHFAGWTIIPAWNISLLGITQLVVEPEQLLLSETEQNIIGEKRI